MHMRACMHMRTRNTRAPHRACIGQAAVRFRDSELGSELVQGTQQLVQQGAPRARAGDVRIPGKRKRERRLSQLR